jgi:hypothetical protein
VEVIFALGFEGMENSDEAEVTAVTKTLTNIQ